MLKFFLFWEFTIFGLCLSGLVLGNILEQVFVLDFFLFVVRQITLAWLEGGFAFAIPIPLVDLDSWQIEAFGNLTNLTGVPIGHLLVVVFQDALLLAGEDDMLRFTLPFLWRAKVVESTLVDLCQFGHIFWNLLINVVLSQHICQVLRLGLQDMDCCHLVEQLMHLIWNQITRHLTRHLQQRLLVSLTHLAQLGVGQLVHLVFEIVNVLVYDTLFIASPTSLLSLWLLFVWPGSHFLFTTFEISHANCKGFPQVWCIHLRLPWPKHRWQSSKHCDRIPLCMQRQRWRRAIPWQERLHRWRTKRVKCSILNLMCLILGPMFKILEHVRFTIVRVCESQWITFGCKGSLELATGSKQLAWNVALVHQPSSVGIGSELVKNLHGVLMTNQVRVSSLVYSRTSTPLGR